jgi:uncharacterized protein YijF (DUF1287 family)
MKELVFLALACGLPDRGIYGDLDAQVTLRMPPGVARAHTWLRVDSKHGVVTIYDGDDPVRAYALRGTLRDRPDAATVAAALAPDDRDELLRFVEPSARVMKGEPPRSEDRDGDGIVDRLDILVGAKKLLFNHARYIDRYVTISYPNGDVPRAEGVCSDTVVRALRNAGIDLQREIHEDILRAPAAYPMVEKIDASINHRRVRTLLPWFQRHFRTMPKGTRYLPGDIVFFDTFPEREGPDHLGVVGDRAGERGLPLVINNWTDGTVDAEMDLLPIIPVTHHFRAPSK